MSRSHIRPTLILVTFGLVSACSSSRPYDYRDYQAPPAVDPFMVNQRVDGGPDGRMTVNGDLVVFDSECGTITVRRLPGPPVVLDEPALTHRGRIEAYDRTAARSSCEGAVGDDVALVAIDIGIPPEFGQPAFTNASVRPIAGDRVLMRWFANIQVRDDRAALPLNHPGRRPGGRW
jgi:hypothetical protein